jgi:hypothetical protein
MSLTTGSNRFHPRVPPHQYVNSINKKIFLLLKRSTFNFYRYGSFPGAASKPNGLAVLGFFYEIVNDGKDYEMFKKLNNPLKTITTTRGTKPTIPNFNLKKFLPENPEEEDFYRYNGSLTTPGCSETVTWTVFKGL